MYVAAVPIGNCRFINLKGQNCAGLSLSDILAWTTSGKLRTLQEPIPYRNAKIGSENRNRRRGFIHP